MNVVLKIDPHSKTITLTRGNTLKATVVLKKRSCGEDYIPIEGDTITFELKKRFIDKGEPLITRLVPWDTMILELRPEDTNGLDPGEYNYDLTIIKADGTVDTVINEAKFIIKKRAV